MSFLSNSQTSNAITFLGSPTPIVSEIPMPHSPRKLPSGASMLNESSYRSSPNTYVVINCATGGPPVGVGAVPAAPKFVFEASAWLRVALAAAGRTRVAMVLLLPPPPAARGLGRAPGAPLDPQ